MNENTIYYYNSAILPQQFNVCGIDLRPFCLGHLLLLERIQSPLLNTEQINLNLGDGLHSFLMALSICALKYEDGIKLLTDDEYAKEAIDVIKTTISKEMEMDKDWNIFYKLDKFKQYMSYFFEMPIYSVEQKDDKPPTGMDWKVGIWQTFKKMGYSESEILNMNMRRLFYEWCSHAENEGVIKVANKNLAKPSTITYGEPPV